MIFIYNFFQFSEKIFRQSKCRQKLSFNTLQRYFKVYFEMFKINVIQIDN